MSDQKISQLTGATTPLAGTEVLPIVQGGSTVKVSVANLTAGRNVGMADLTTTGNTILGDASTDTLNVGNGDLVKDGSGNVGVGISPAANRGKLQVYATGNQTDESGAMSVGDTTVGGMRLYVGVNNTGEYVYVGSVKSGTGYRSLILQPNGGDTSLGAGNLVIGTAGKGITTNGAYALGLGTNGSVNGLTIASGNKVYVNSTTAPVVGSEIFGVAGGSAIAGAFGSTDAAQPTIFISNSSNTTNTYVMRFACGSGGNTRGEIYYNGSAMVYATSSDYRLKENVRPLTNALDKLSQLKPKSFRWIEHQIEDYGFLAHELQTVFPQSVGGEKDEIDERGKPKYQTIDASSPSVIATMVAATLELKQIVDAQAAEIAALKGN